MCKNVRIQLQYVCAYEKWTIYNWLKKTDFHIIFTINLWYEIRHNLVSNLIEWIIPFYPDTKTVLQALNSTKSILHLNNQVKFGAYYFSECTATRSTHPHPNRRQRNRKRMNPGKVHSTFGVDSKMALLDAELNHNTDYHFQKGVAANCDPSSSTEEKSTNVTSKLKPVRLFQRLVPRPATKIPGT